MTLEEFENWVLEVRTELPKFVRNMAVASIPGKYRLTMTGDLISPNAFWGLGQTTFAVRILYESGALTAEDVSAHEIYIRRFEGGDGFISDPEIRNRSFRQRVLSGVRHLDWETLTNRMTARAETRQAVAALHNLGKTSAYIFQGVPYETNGVTHYLNRLDWTRPWGASSHVNHLLFFLKRATHLPEDKKTELISQVMRKIHSMRRQDGSFSAKGSDLPAHQRVGSAMKILMGTSLVGECLNVVSKELVDTALDDPAVGDACEHFNTLYVLAKCSEHLDYRREEIRAFALRKAREWQKYYWPAFGGFSFNIRQSAIEYYGARISKGNPEPDLHGSAMFFWGLLVAAQILGLNQKLGLREPLL